MAKGTIVVQIDRWELHIDPEKNWVKFYPRQIYLGEIVRRRHPSFTLRRSDFNHYPEAWVTLVEWLHLWT